MTQEFSYKNRLRRQALTLVWIGEGWNLLETVVALWAGARAGSIALMAYGLDGMIELFAGGVLIWHLNREWEDGHEKAGERKALRLVGVTFFLLAVYIFVQSSATLMGWLEEPRESVAGIALVVASALVMTWLYLGKMRTARRLGSAALRALLPLENCRPLKT